MTNIGRVDLLVDLDGKGIPARARVIGNEVGEEAGQAATQRFNARFSKIGGEIANDLRSSGKLSGITFSDSMENAIEGRLRGIADKIANAFLTPQGLDNFSKDFVNVDDAAKDLRGSLQELHDAGSLNEKMWNRFGGTLNQWLGKARVAQKQNDSLSLSLEKLTPNLEKAGAAAKKSGKDADDSNFGWKNLSHNLRQVLLIIGAIAAGGSDIAVLGSAAGAGLTILGGAAVTAGVGLGVLIAALQGVGDKLSLLKERTELDSIAPKDRTDAQIARLKELNATISNFDPSIAAIGKLGVAFHGLQDSIEDALLKGAGPAIDNLTNVLLPALQTGLDGVATALNFSFQDLITRLTGPEGIAKLGTILSDIQGQIPELVSTIGNIGGAIGGILVAAGPFVDDFLGWLDKITGKFDDFVNSVQGQNALADWFSNGEKVLSSFTDLLAAAGKVLSGLVDDESVKRTTEFLDHLTEAMPFIEKLVDVLGTLDVFGLAAQLLDSFGNALIPVLDLLDPFFQIINSIVSAAIQFQSMIVSLVSIALLPFNAVLEVVALVIQKVTDYFKPLFDNVTLVYQAVLDAADSIFAALLPAIDQLLDSLIGLLPSPEELASIITTKVIPAIQDFAKWLTETAVPAVESLIGHISDFIDSFGGFDGISEKVGALAATLTIFGDGIKLALAPGLFAVQTMIDALIQLGILKKNVKINGHYEGSLFIPGNAAGGIAGQSTLGVFGEKGPEALVPLSRNLSQVDPSVRYLSAIAQGKAVPSSGGDGRSVTVAEGAIQIVGVSNGDMAASAALDRFVALAA